MFDPHAIRHEFPIFDSLLEGHPLIYLDSAASAQKPRVVLEAMARFAEHDYANVNRGMHVLAERATVAYDAAREAVRAFINAKHAHEIVFTKNCTEAINLVAKSWGKMNVTKADVIVLSVLEHHSNIVPWLQLKEEIGCAVQWIDCDDEGNLKLEELDQFLKKGNIKLVSVTAQSNVLGVRPPIQEIIKKSHDAGALVLIDAAQSIAHHQTNVSSRACQAACPSVARKRRREPRRSPRDDSGAEGCDFLAFSGHKLYGPTGIGVLYAKEELLERMPPFLGGGGVIQTVERDSFTSADIPERFEAGTQPIIEAVGLKAAIEWLTQFDWKDIEAHESALLRTAYDELSTIEGLRIIGPNMSSRACQAEPRRSPRDDPSGCLSFVIDGIHPHDLTELLSKEGICLRAGHHCTQPLHKRFGLTATTRLSVGIYNTNEEIEAIGKSIQRVRQSFDR